MKVIDIADEIFRELSEPDDITVPAVSFWLLTNVGSLSDIINSDIIVESAELSPELTDSQKGIYKSMYFVYYWKRQVNKNLGAAAYNSFQEIREGDRTIVRVNKNEIAKTFMSLLRTAQDELNQRIISYRQKTSNTDVISTVNPVNDEDIIGNYVGPYSPQSLFFERRI